MGYLSGHFEMAALLVGVWMIVLFIGITTGQRAVRDAVSRWTTPKQSDVVAGDVHREPVYPGEDDPVHMDGSEGEPTGP